MKRRMILMAVAVLISAAAMAQVEIQNFKFSKDSPFGCCPDRKMTSIKFKVTSKKAIKTLDVQYVGVDQVGDAVCSDIVGAVNANAEHTKYNILHCVGPFEPGKSYKRVASGAFYYPTKLIAFPTMIIIDYMDRSPSDKIVITKENLNQYFPKMQWIDVDFEHGFQPDN